MRNACNDTTPHFEGDVSPEPQFATTHLGTGSRMHYAEPGDPTGGVSESPRLPLARLKPRHKPHDPKRKLRWQFGGHPSSCTTREYARWHSLRRPLAREASETGTSAPADRE